MLLKLLTKDFPEGQKFMSNECAIGMAVKRLWSDSKPTVGAFYLSIVHKNGDKEGYRINGDLGYLPHHWAGDTLKARMSDNPEEVIDTIILEPYSGVLQNVVYDKV